MCRDEFLNYRRVREWQDVHGQLREVADELGLLRNRAAAPADAIHRSLLAGLLSHVGRKDPDGFEYRGTRGARFAIAPGSTLFKRSPEWVMAGELVETSRLWARGVCRVRPEWVEQAAAHLVRRSHSDPWWDAERGAALAAETVTLYGLTLVSGRTVAYGRIDPAAARELFIRHALVGGEWAGSHEFVERNRARIEEVQELEARARRPGLLVDDDAIAAWFDARLPDGITSVRHFDAWWKTARLADPHLLDLTPADLIDPSAEPPDETAFPRVWSYGDVDFPIEYRFDPEAADDGITVDVPVTSLEMVDPAAFDWHVPGLRAEVVEALVRSLPKSLRRRFVPIPETVRTLLARLRPEEGGLVDTLRRELGRIAGAPIPPDALDPDSLPPHLRPRFRVVDAGGHVLAEGRDLAALKAELRQDLREAAAAHPLEQVGLTRWSIGELPRVVELGRGVRAYPALVDEGDSVAVRLLATREEQAEAMWEGVRRLLVLGLPSPTRLLRPLLTDAATRTLRDGPYDEAAEWAADCLTAALDRVLAGAGGLPRDGVTFDALVGRAREEIADRLAETARTSLEILALRRSVLAALDRPAAAPATFGPVLEDVVEQLDRLVYPGFLTSLGANRLTDVARYLRAIERRLERLPEHPARDAELMASVRRLEQEHDRLRDVAPQSEELREVGWMLQELRVSLFAQALGTHGSVSEQRIRRVLERVATGG
jgi:ATP-dependent helicase HrpA